MGVRTACAIAHLRPDWVSGLCLIDLGFSGLAGGGLGEGLADFLESLPDDFPDRAHARAFMNLHCPDPSIGNYLMAVSVADPRGKISFPFDRQALIQTIHAARNVSIRPWVLEAAKRRTPILVLRGEKSLVWSHEEFTEEKAHFSKFENVTFEEFPGAGHGLPFEQRTAFIARLREKVGPTL
jgi:pimeloyl-ACP methyl ester carboxylesterase